MPEIIIAGNWKMYGTSSEAVGLAIKIKDGVKKKGQSQFFSVVVCPPFTVLGDVKKVLEGSSIKLGGQNMFWEKEGAWTGEVSAGMLVSAGCEFVILGHSERRLYFGERDSDINKKIKAAISAGLKPIVCCGEKLDERENGMAGEVVESQIRGVFDGIDGDNLQKCVIAYEPVWAIGTGKTATPQTAQEMHGVIRNLLSQLYSPAVAESLSILYGGSVKPENIKELMAEKDINGALVGGASLKADSFLKIIEIALEK